MRKKQKSMFIEIQLNGETKRYYRYRTQDDGIVDYYDENGRSAKKFLMRKPAPGAKFRSPFGWRRHPILKIMRLHKGVDWSAPAWHADSCIWQRSPDHAQMVQRLWQIHTDPAYQRLCHRLRAYDALRAGS